MTEREEQAFRDAFVRAGDSFPPKELDMDPKPTARRRAWPLLAAAAAVLVAGGIGYGLVRQGDDESRRPEPASPSTLGGELPVPPEGWHWESRYDLAVQVPDDWGYGPAPRSDWCIRDERPPAPYVDPWSGLGGVRSIGCMQDEGIVPAFGPAPERLWQTHVELAPYSPNWNVAYGGMGGPAPGPGEYDGSWRHGGWTKVVKVIGMAKVAVVYDEAHAEQAAQILASVRRIASTNPDGCSITSSIQIQSEAYPRPTTPFDIDDVDTVDTLTVCQYQQAPEGVPALLASRSLSGAEAQGVLEAIQAAPNGSGPNSPGTCINDRSFDQALVLRLDEEHELYVFNDGCLGNGFDDGTGRHHLTPESCGPLYEGPVASFGGSGVPFRACFPDR